MSDRWRWSGLLLGASLLLPGLGRAQSTTALQDRFARLADSTATLRRAINTREERRQAITDTDTLRSGGLTVVSRGAMPRTVVAAVPLAWQRLVARFGERQATAAAAVEIEATTGPQLSALTLRPASAAVNRSAPVRGSVVRLASIGGDSLAEVIAAVASRRLWEGTDSVLRGWRESADPAWSLGEMNLEDLYEQLVTSRWIVPRRCFLGDLASCRGLLALDPTLHVLLASYTPEERELVVGRMAAYASGRVVAEKIGACLNRHDTAACAEVLVEAFPEPWSHRGALGPPARQALLALALEMGGPGAFDTLRASAPAPMGERLARTAGVSVDSLVTRWRNVILAARPATVAVTPAGGWTALGWATLLGLMALGSSRWR